jgi:hypothetical protein
MLRLRQICLVARHLDPIVDELKTVLGLEECFRDPVVLKYGLENVLAPVGRNFLEIVAPIRSDTAAERYIDRRGGDGGYIIILQCDDPKRRRSIYSELNIRIANSMDYGDFIGTQLHPKDTGGCMLEVDHQEGNVIDGPWHPAGNQWENAVQLKTVKEITGATLQAQHPHILATHWGKILDRSVVASAHGHVIELDNANLEFVSSRDDRGDGLIGIQLTVNDRAGILKAAKRLGLPTTTDHVTICGTHFYLSETNGFSS